MLRRHRWLVKICAVIVVCGFVWLLLSLKIFESLNAEEAINNPQADDSSDSLTYQPAAPSGVDVGCAKVESVDRRPECLMFEYCNSPFIPVTGSEGTKMDGYKLRQVHIFTRHGDRSPGKTIPGHMPPNLNCNFSNWYKGADDKIQAFAPKMDSMSDPVPFHQKRLYPNRASCQPRSLTARGALQHIKLGQFLQNVYMNKQGLIDKVNPYGPQLLLKSTIHSRTFESAMAFLYGFIPQFDVSKLAFEVVKHTGFCSEKSPNITSCLCQRYLDTDKRIRHRKSHSNKWETYILQRVISGIFEQPSKDIPIMTSVGDALTPGFCHSSAPPCGPLGSQNYKSQNETTCVTLDLMGKIWKEITKELKAHSDDEYLLAATLKLYPVLFEIASRMDDLRSFRFAPRFVLYSGHDITVTPLLLILGLHDGKWPPYASRLVIETVESLKTKDYHVRFIYNGVDRTSDTVFCKSSALNDGLCPLDLFLKFVFTDVLQNFGYASYKEACRS